MGEYILQKLVTIILTYKSDHGRVAERIIVGYSIEGETGIIYSTELWLQGLIVNFNWGLNSVPGLFNLETQNFML